MFGGRSEAQVADLEIEVGRLKGRVAGLEELLESKDKQLLAAAADRDTFAERYRVLLERFVDLADRRGVSSEPSTTSPQAGLRPRHESSSGNGSTNDDDDDVPPRLTRKQRQLRQQDKEMVEQSFMSRDDYLEKWGRFEDDQPLEP